MKLLATLVLSTIVGSALAIVVGKDIIQTADGDFLTSRACPLNDCTFYDLIPRPGHIDGRKKRSLKISENRRLEGVEGPVFEKGMGESVAADLIVDSARPICITVSGVTEGMEYVLTKEGDDPYELKYALTAKPFLYDDETRVSVGHLHPMGGEGAYSQSIVYQEGGEEKTLDGGKFTLDHEAVVAADMEILRRSGSASDQEIVEEAAYEGGGQVQIATGRIYFSSLGVDYACTGTAIKDHKSGRSLILTAAHCIWDDIDENFGSKVLFIPNRDAVTGETFLRDVTRSIEQIHRYCKDDVCGCWDISGGVVHDKWPSNPWPDRLAYDYGVYVVNDVGSHKGADCGSDALDIAVDPFDFVIGTTLEGEYVNNFGYSLEFNPDFRYCAESTITRDPTEGVTTAWMDNCGLTGGASGGPWMKNFDPASGKGEIVSVSSWSHQNRTGMGGPFIDESEARCLINAARDADMDWMMAQDAGYQGIYASCHNRPCVEREASTRKLRGDRELCSGEEEESKP